MSSMYIHSSIHPFNTYTQAYLLQLHAVVLEDDRQLRVQVGLEGLALEHRLEAPQQLEGVLDGGDVLEALWCVYLVWLFVVGWIGGERKEREISPDSHIHTTHCTHLVDEPLQRRLQLRDARVELPVVPVELAVVVVQQVVALAAEVLFDLCVCV